MNIRIKDLKKVFKKNTVVDIANLELKSNSIYGLYGRNGSGKTVLLNLLCGYYTPTSGSITINGINYNKENKFPDNTRALIGSPSFYDDINAYENLKILAQIQNKISEKEINNALEIVNLNEKNKVFKEFSLGMKQKLGIAQAIMEKPNLLILDEPFNGIERTSVEKITNYLKEYKDENKIIIISSHIKEDLEKICDKYIYIDDGKTKIVGSLNEI